MKIPVLAGAALLALSACGPADSAPAAKAEAVKPDPKSATNILAASEQEKPAPVDLAPYIGKYPFDVVNGHRILDHPAVKAALAAAVPDAKTRAGVAFAEKSLGVPIVRVKGGRLLVWGGEWRAEDRYNWAVVIAPDGSKPEVCIYDGVGYGEDFQSSQWFEPGQPGIMKQGTCPSAAEDYPPAEIAAG